MSKFVRYFTLLMLLSAPMLLKAQCMVTSGSGSDAVVVNSITESGGNCTYNITYTHTVNQNGVKWVNFTFSGQQVCHLYNGSNFVVAPTCTGSGSNAGKNTVFTHTASFTIPCSTTPAFSWQASTSSGNTSTCGDGVTAINYGSLPVTLTSFSGKETSEGVQLGWVSASETNFSHFLVQKSSNAKNFETVGKVNPSASRTYEFIDLNPFEPYTYYRLLTKDLNRREAFSQIIAVDVDMITDPQIYPNPAGSNKFSIRGIDVSKAIQLTNLTGQKLPFIKTVKSDDQVEVLLQTVPRSQTLIIGFISTFGKNITKKIILE